MSADSVVERLAREYGWTEQYVLDVLAYGNALLDWAAQQVPEDLPGVASRIRAGKSKEADRNG